ncbi:unnamed protein product [Orchesella dallaii]|uniref:G-protein coupled receptors family 1 profile domain-containing protein n=1 Tax=Orchesella dallaii TaxID=48710 RepID=A0ABP1R188_9HEXA
MDYTKDAILIHDGVKAFQESVEENDGFLLGKQTSSSAATGNLLPPSPQNISTMLLTNLSESLSSISSSISTSPPPPIPSLSSPFDDNEHDFNDTLDYIPYSMRPETYIVPVLFAIIFIVGVIGNGTLIVIFIKHRSMRNVPNMFIVSLAIGDLLVILFCVPFTSTVYTVDSWPYGVVVCKFSEFIKDLSQCVSVFTLTALSADRYFAIVDPMRKLTGRRATKITIISIIGIWTLSVLFALPSALYSYVRVFPEDDELEEGSGSGNGSVYGEEEGEEEDLDFGRTLQVCYPYPKEFGPVYAQAMVMFHFLVYYAVPLFFIATFYIIMARHLVLSTINMPGEATGQGKQIQARKKVAKMILSFVVIFAICFFPHHLFLLWFYFYPDAEDSFNDFWNFCRILGFCLSFANSCINPITLYCVSGTFRKQFNDHLFCCCRCDDSNSRRGPNGVGRQSGGGMLRGGRGGGGLCAACVSLSGNNGQLHGNDSRYGNGGTSRGGNGRLQRGSTMNSDRMMSKRKSTWETQTTVVNHRLLNIPGGVKGGNVHVNNLCSEHEHEHIPLKNMKLQIPPHSKSSPRGTIITDAGLNHQHHHHLLLNPEAAGAPSTTSLVSGNVHARKNSAGSGKSRRRSSSILTKNNKVISDNHHHTQLEEEMEGILPKVELNLSHNHPKSFIEEENEKSISSPTQNTSPTKSSSYNNKMGEIFSKISQKCTSPKRVISNSGGSSPSKKSPSKQVQRSSSSFNTASHDEHEEEMNNFNNNNNYTKHTQEESHSGLGQEEYTETTLIQVPEQKQRLLGNNLDNNVAVGSQVIICYN